MESKFKPGDNMREEVGGHVHYIMATAIPTSLLTLEKAIKRQLKIAAEVCSVTPESELHRLCEAVDTMYAELHEALDTKPSMPGFPEFIMPSMVRDLGHSLPRAYKGHRPPVVSESVKRYLAYWAQKKAPKCNLYRCTHCNKQLKTIRPPKGERFTTLALCPYCSGAYHLTVTEFRVEVKTNGNKHPD